MIPGSTLLKGGCFGILLVLRANVQIQTPLKIVCTPKHTSPPTTDPVILEIARTEVAFATAEIEHFDNPPWSNCAKTLPFPIHSAWNGFRPFYREFFFCGYFFFQHSDENIHGMVFFSPDLPTRRLQVRTFLDFKSRAVMSAFQFFLSFFCLLFQEGNQNGVWTRQRNVNNGHFCIHVFTKFVTVKKNQ